MFFFSVSPKNTEQKKDTTNISCHLYCWLYVFNLYVLFIAMAGMLDDWRDKETQFWRFTLALWCQRRFLKRLKTGRQTPSDGTSSLELKINGRRQVIQWALELYIRYICRVLWKMTTPTASLITFLSIKIKINLPLTRKKVFIFGENITVNNMYQLCHIIVIYVTNKVCIIHVCYRCSHPYMPKNKKCLWKLVSYKHDNWASVC